MLYSLHPSALAAAVTVMLPRLAQANSRAMPLTLVTKSPANKFTRMMNCKNPHSFVYPHDRLLRLKSTIPDNEMRQPAAFDKVNEQCLMVIKRGNTTNLFT
jgi:hypothetical protein